MLRPQPIECPGGIHHLMRRGAQTPMTRAWTAARLSMGIASDLSGLLGEAKLSIVSSDPLSAAHSPTPIPVLAVPGATGAKANS